jgi:hypothetical protein
MSKKSRKRNKKILAAIGAGLGAMALAKSRRNTLIDKGIAAADADKGSDMLASAKNYITKKAAPVVDTGSNFQSRFKSRVGNEWKGPGEITNIANQVTGVEHPIHTAVRVPPGRMRRFSKGGRVTGIAKRGFGRALMKGKK